MLIRRLILALLTILALVQVLSSLGSSLSQPQIANRLELYQTNLILYITEYPVEEEETNLRSTLDSLVGKEPLVAAEKQYQKTREQAITNRNNFKTQLKQLETRATTDRSNLENITDARDTRAIALQQGELTKQIQENNNFINELELKIGILEAARGKTDRAISTWEKILEPTENAPAKFVQTAKVLKNLWSEPSLVTEQAESIIRSNLDGWLRDRALEKLYISENRQGDLADLQTQKENLALQALIKLSLISSLPFLGGSAGFLLLVFLLFQWLWKKDKAILAINSNTPWSTPWDWEIIWQVLVVGFFFIGQFLLPFILGISGFNPANYSIRIKALYVFFTYVLMSVGGLTVLYLSIKSFLPLPENWFKFKFTSNWFLWGFGGYLVALPLVLLVSLINQQIWQGQGGSNPLLFLALQAQDTVALAVFFITASIAAPIFEETLFRGFLLSSLTRYVPVWGAILISGIIFAIAHLSLSEVLPLTVLGIILGFVYTRSRNLLAPMLLHSLFNSGTLFSLFVLGSGLG